MLLSESSTAEYVTETLTASTTTSDNPIRKLLVLDLNGTLVIHSRNADPELPEKLHPTNVRNLPHLRAVVPRPYISSFAAFLGHPETKTWLDTMIWSSSQRSNVQDMTHVCFRNKHSDTGPLVAVWARDTYGTSEGHYENSDKESRIPKDLTKVWTGHHLPGCATFEAPASQCPSFDDVVTEPEHVDESEPGLILEVLQPQHNARTTLLLDHSSTTMHPQPWNHMRVREYDMDIRAHDLGLARRLARPGNSRTKTDPKKRNASDRDGDIESVYVDAKQTAQRPQKRLKPATASSTVSDVVVEDVATSSLPNSFSPASVSETRSLNSSAHITLVVPENGNVARRKRPRGTRAGRQRQAAGPDVVSLEPAQPCSSHVSDNKQQAAYDETLLAVIGVLNAVKFQSNISAWIRSGGLLFQAKDTEADVPWFQNKEAFGKWVQMGRHALEVLGITLTPGVRV